MTLPAHVALSRLLLFVQGRPHGGFQPFAHPTAICHLSGKASCEPPVSFQTPAEQSNTSVRPVISQYQKCTFDGHSDALLNTRPLDRKNQLLDSHFFIEKNVLTSSVLTKIQALCCLLKPSI